MSDHAALKEYWSHPERDRRKKDMPGRREDDFEVCPFHAGHCAQNIKDIDSIDREIDELRSGVRMDVEKIHKRIDDTNSSMVGKWAFGIVITVLLAMIAGFGSLNYQINSLTMAEIKKVEKAISSQR